MMCRTPFYRTSTVLPLSTINWRKLTLAVVTACLSIQAQAQAQTPAQNTTYRYEYDAMGNVTKIVNPLNAATLQSYDPLGRLQSQTDANSQITQYAYDGQGRLTQVTDARNLSTLYSIDGLGNQLRLTSPDTGTTTNTVDAAGNILTSTDAKGQLTRYTYDALNRVTTITYNDGQLTRYTYDQGANAKGRLSLIEDNLGSIQYAYDNRGRLLSETRRISGSGNTNVSVVSYQYDATGHLNKLTYPNGRILSYTRDSMGRITQIDTSQDGVNLTILSQVVYRPFGGVQGYKNSAGQSYQRGFDLDGRISSYTLNNAVQAISYDAANRITAINEVSNPNRQISYGYDNTDRLTSYLTPQTNQNFTYDPVGNRRSKTNGTSTSTYSYDNTSNRLSQVSGSLTSTITMDANGSTTNNGSAQFAYDVRGRMISATTTAGVVQYQVNALGQRVQKTASVAGNNVSTLYHYDQGGHLISEQRGQSHVDYVYLDDIPVAVLK